MVEAIRQEFDQPTHEQAEEQERTRDKRVILVSHSPLFYWWPVWVVGYVMAGITWFFGESVSIGGAPAEQIHMSTTLGVVYTLVLFGVLLCTHVTMRGIIAAVVVLAALLLAVLFELLGWWTTIIAMVPDLSVHMNFGFYMLLSTLVFITWALTFFIFDRLTYWRIEAGQVTQERLVGGGETSYDTSGIVFSEKHDDPFRHWVLGFGAGDLTMTIRGAATEEVVLPNVLFANSKVTKAQQLLQRKPD